MSEGQNSFMYDEQPVQDRVGGASADTGSSRALPLRNKMFWFAVSLSFLVGLAINLLPVTFKVFSTVFKVGYAKQGSTESLYFIGGLIGCVAAGFATERLGLSKFSRAGLIIAGSGCILIGSARQFEMIRGGALLVGLGCVWMVIVYNTIVATFFQHIRQKVFAAVTLAMAVGGTLGPMGMGSYISYAWQGHHWPWWIPYVGLGILFYLYMIFLPSLQTPPQQTEQKSERSAHYGFLLRSPALWLIGLLTILHGLGQIGAVVWLARLYETRLGLPESRVGMMISANVFGFITGRMVLTRLGGRLPDRVLLGCSACVGSICYVLTILNPHFYLGVVLMYMAGFGMSGDAVSLQSFTALRFRDAAPKAFAFTQALGNIGAAAGPFIVGFLGERSGTLETAVWIVPMAIGLLSLAGFSWHLRDRFKDKNVGTAIG